MGFEVEGFVAELRAALGGADAPARIAEVVRRAIADPAALAETVRARQAARGKPTMAEVFVNDDDLTAYHLAWPPGLFGAPHDHAGWAVVGVYRGAEAFNVYAPRADGSLRKIGRQVIAAPAVEVLAADLIHDIEAGGETASGSLHVYPNKHFVLPARRVWRALEGPPEAFSTAKAFDYGMALTNRRRAAAGLAPTEPPAMPEGVVR